MSKKKPLLSELELLIVEVHEVSINHADANIRYLAQSLLKHYLNYKTLTAKQKHLANKLIK